MGSTRESSNAHGDRCYGNAKVPLSLVHVAWIILVSIGTANIKIIRYRIEMESVEGVFIVFLVVFLVIVGN